MDLVKPVLGWVRYIYAVESMLLLAGCASFPSHFGSQVDSVHGTLSTEFLGVRAVHEISYLGGAMAANQPRLAYTYSENGVDVRIFCDDDVCNAADLATYAGNAAKLPAAVETLTGEATGVSELTLLLIPRGYGYRWQSFSWAPPGKLGMSFALHIDADPKQALAAMVRRISHELTHVAIAWSRVEMSQALDEQLAYTTELCAELLVLGRTERSGNAVPTAAAWAQVQVSGFEALKLSARVQFAADPELDAIFAAGPLLDRQSARGAQLLSLCHQRLQDALSGSRHQASGPARG